MNFHRRSGFTLIEALLYSTFVGMIMSGAVLLTYTALTVRSKVRASAILEENVRTALWRIQSLVNSASGITSPATSTVDVVLILTMSTPSENPTTIGVSNGVLMLTQGTGAAMALTSQEVILSNVSFTRVSSTAPMVRTVLSGGLRNAALSYPTMIVTSTDLVRR